MEESDICIISHILSKCLLPFKECFVAIKIFWCKQHRDNVSRKTFGNTEGVKASKIFSDGG